MAFRTSGIRLIAQGARTFISEVSRANKEVNKFGLTAEQTARKITNLGKQVNNLGITIAKTARGIKETQDGLEIFGAKSEAYVSSAGNAFVRWRDVATGSILSVNQVVDRALDQFDELAAEAVFVGDAMTKMGGQMSGAAAAGGGLVARLSAAAPQILAIASAIGVVVGAFLIFITTIRRVTSAIINLVRNGVNFLVNSLETLAKTAVKIGSAVLSPIASLVTNILGVTLGRGLGDIFRRVGEAARGLIADMDETLSLFQRLDIQFESLLARDIAEQLGMEMGDAFKYAGAQAQKLLEWVKDIAVITPFTVKNLTTTLAMATAMGLNVDEAKRLTEATGNFVAAMGLTEDHMFRIIYNFGQMLSQGKLNGREFRDLANSFVPVWRMMARMGEQADMTAQEFKELAFEGGVPVREFLEEFIRMANEDFPGAMKKMARTWQGVVNNIKDFIEVVLGVELLGPVFDRFTEIAANALDNLLVPSIRQTAGEIGHTLLLAVDQIIPAFNEFFDALRDLARAFGITGISAETFRERILALAIGIRRGLQAATAVVREWATNLQITWRDLAQRAFEWGKLIIEYFARGMALAIPLIVSVINTISSLLASWFGPGSPPKVAPDLPKWGMDAMREWLKGFTLAEFDVLTGIQGPLKEALSILVETARLTEKQGGSIFRNISMMIAEALAMGNVSEDLFDSIADMVPVWGEDIAELARRYVALAEAINAVEAAEEALAAAQEAEQQARIDVRQSVLEYNKLLREGADSAILAARLEELNAQEDAARLATEERKEAEDALDSAKEMLEIMREQVQLQEELLNQLLDITKEQIIQPVQAVLDTGGLEDAIADLEDIEVPFTLDQLKLDRAMDAWSQRLQAIADQYALVDARENFEKFAAAFEARLAEMFAPITELTQPGGALYLLQEAWNSLLASFGLVTLDPFGDAEPGEIAAELAFDPEAFAPSQFQELLDVLTEFRNRISEISNTYLPIFRDTLISIGNYISIIAGDGEGGLGGLSAVLNVVAGAFKVVMFTIAVFLKWVEALIGFLAILVTAFRQTKDFIIEAWGIARDYLVDTTNDFTQKMGDRIDEFRSWWDEDMQGLLDKAVEVFIAIGLQIEEWATDFADWLIAVGDAIQDFIDDPIDALLTAFDWIIEKAQDVVEWLGKIINKLSGNVLDLITGGGGPSEQAEGGPVSKGLPYIVGERGPELFIPNMSGMIVSNQQLRDAMGSMLIGSSVASGQSVTTNIVNINFGGVSVHSPMTLAQLEATVANTVKREMGYGYS